MLSRWLSILVLPLSLSAGVVVLPERRAEARTGAAVAEAVSGMNLNDREDLLVREISQGNVPNWWRKFVPVTVHLEIDGTPQTLVYEVSPDVVMVGDDVDAMRVPLSPVAAQTLAGSLDCLLPTSQMSAQIYAAAEVKLTPHPLTPGPDMTGFAKFLAHEKIVDSQRAENPALPGTLVAGHKKDVVVSAKLCEATGKVAIFGWHKTSAQPIQPLYLGHTENWVDYSHGVRLVRRQMQLNGKSVFMEDLLADAKLSKLLGAEGPLLNPRYDTDRTTTMKLDPGVRVVIKAPFAWVKTEPVRLVIYATPNGSTAEQTIGRIVASGGDWHYQIQNIGAQTHWLRDHANLRNLVVAYLEPEGKSWSAWRKKFDAQNQLIPRLIEAISQQFKGQDVRLTLTGHSGGGSFIFGYFNAVSEIPAAIERIAFLDSNYNWETERHVVKFSNWLKGSPEHRLCVLAYEDCVALLNGKTFVSESGGTWGRSLQMLQDLGKSFPLERKEDDDFIRANSAAGQIQFLLRKNPAKKVLHSVLVERNGFIQGIIGGTNSEGQGYEYFGPRAYAPGLPQSPQ